MNRRGFFGLVAGLFGAKALPAGFDRVSGPLDDEIGIDTPSGSYSVNLKTGEATPCDMNDWIRKELIPHVKQFERINKPTGDVG